MKVSFHLVESYDSDIIKEKIVKALENVGGFTRFFSDNDKILLKPNLLASDNPETGVTTHPIFFEGIIKFLQQESKKNNIKLNISCGDSPAVSSGTKVAKDCGILQVCEKYNIPFIEFKEKLTINGNPKNIIKNFEISSEVMEFDKIISLAKLKNHSLTVFTGGVKNLFGCIPGKTKAYYHTRFADSVIFSKMLVDLADSLKTGICIMDGIIAHEGHGPRGGNPIKLGYLIVGENPFIVDLLASTLVGYNPQQIPFLKYYSEKHNVSLYIKDHEIFGENLVFRNDFKRISSYKTSTIPSRFRKGFIYNNIISSKPVFDRSKCILCMQCYNICPTNPKSIKIMTKKISTNNKAITKGNNNIENNYNNDSSQSNQIGKNNVERLKYNYDTCIRCFCCQEICPNKAINIKHSIVGKILKKLR